MKFLIDECLSPELALIARARGCYESTHVTWLGMRSRKDWTIVGRAIKEGFILVTNNAVDFTALYGREEIHAGLVCLNVAPNLMNLEIQKSLLAWPNGVRASSVGLVVAEERSGFNRHRLLRLGQWINQGGCIRPVEYL